MRGDRPRDAARSRAGACEHCGYIHADDHERALASRWHEAHDAGAGLRFELETLLQDERRLGGAEDEP